MHIYARVIFVAAVSTLFFSLEVSGEKFVNSKVFDVSAIPPSKWVPIPIPYNLLSDKNLLKSIKIGGYPANGAKIDVSGRFILVPPIEKMGNSKLTAFGGVSIISRNERLNYEDIFSGDVPTIIYPEKGGKISLPKLSKKISNANVQLILQNGKIISAKIKDGKMIVASEELDKIGNSDAMATVIQDGNKIGSISFRLARQSASGVSNIYVATRSPVDSYLDLIGLLKNEYLINSAEEATLKKIANPKFKLVSGLKLADAGGKRVCGQYINEITISNEVKGILIQPDSGRTFLDPTTTLYPDAPSNLSSIKFPSDENEANSNRYRQLVGLGLYGDVYKNIISKIKSQNITPKLHIIDSWMGNDFDSQKYKIKQKDIHGNVREFVNIGHGLIIKRIAEYVGGGAIEYIPHNICGGKYGDGCSILALVREICSIGSTSKDGEIDVINISLGTPNNISYLNKSLLDVLDEHVSIVISNGNRDNCDRSSVCSQYPADYLNQKNSDGDIKEGYPEWQGAYTVAANYNNRYAEFNRPVYSSEISIPSILAPGVFIYGSRSGADAINLSPKYDIDNSYERSVVVRAGASFSTPVFAAALSIWRACHKMNGGKLNLNGPTREDVSWKTGSNGVVNPNLNLNTFLSHCL